MVRLRRLVAILALGAALAACGDDAPSRPSEDAPTRPEPRRGSDPDHPSVTPERCVPQIRPERLATPNADAVARTRWVLVRVGSCRIPDEDHANNRASFMDGWAGLPADCNSQSGRFRAAGTRFIIDSDEVGTTLVGCAPDGPHGYLREVTSWGIDDEDRLLLLDRDGYAVFVLRAEGEPGCILRQGNASRIAAHGRPGCDTSGLDNDLRE